MTGQYSSKKSRVTLSSRIEKIEGQIAELLNITTNWSLKRKRVGPYGKGGKYLTEEEGEEEHAMAMNNGAEYIDVVGNDTYQSDIDEPAKKKRRFIFYKVNKVILNIRN